MYEFNTMAKEVFPMEVKETIDANGILLELLKENWAHGRHIETERLDFTSIYVAIVGGTLAFIGSDFNVTTMCPIFAFLSIFSFLGFQLSKKWGNVFDEHMRKIEKILDEFSKDGIKGRDFMEFPRYDKKLPLSKTWKRTKNLFNGFYILMMVIWTSLFVFSLLNNILT